MLEPAQPCPAPSVAYKQPVENMKQRPWRGQNQNHLKRNFLSPGHCILSPMVPRRGASPHPPSAPHPHHNHERAAVTHGPLGPGRRVASVGFSFKFFSVEALAWGGTTRGGKGRKRGRGVFAWNPSDTCTRQSRPHPLPGHCCCSPTKLFRSRRSNAFPTARTGLKCHEVPHSYSRGVRSRPRTSQPYSREAAVRPASPALAARHGT